MPRPKNPLAPTSAQRTAASRARRGLRTVELDVVTITALDAIRARDGDRTRAGVVARLTREAR